MLKLVLPFLLLLLCLCAGAQTRYVYANTNNLLLRSQPEKNYIVYAILNATAQVELLDYDDYKNDKAVKNRFYQVRWFYTTDDGRTADTRGWVEKKYMVNSMAAVTEKHIDTVGGAITAAPLITYWGSEEYDPNRDNYKDYPWPKYKGGEIWGKAKAKAATVHKYYSGPLGGCYYLGGTGRKVYVDPKYCKPTAKPIPAPNK